MKQVPRAGRGRASGAAESASASREWQTRGVRDFQAAKPCDVRAPKHHQGGEGTGGKGGGQYLERGVRSRSLFQVTLA